MASLCRSNLSSNFGHWWQLEQRGQVGVEGCQQALLQCQKPKGATCARNAAIFGGNNLTETDMLYCFKKLGMK